MELRGPSVVVSTRILDKARQQDALKTSGDGTGFQGREEVDGSPASMQQKIVEMADDMANLAAQFQRRREAERKGAEGADSFDRILDEEVKPKADRLVKLAGAHKLPADQLLQQARAMFPDESDLFLVLRELLKRRQLTKAQRAGLRALIQMVEQEANPKRLKGGIHCALKAKLYGRKRKLDARRLRDTYRSFLDGLQSAVSSYEEWVGTYGVRHRGAVMNFVEESLAIDIHAADPSCNRLEFGALLDTVRKLRLLRAADIEFVGHLAQRAALGAPATCNAHVGKLQSHLRPTDYQKHEGEEDDEEDVVWILLLCSLLRGVRLEDALADSLGEAMRLRAPEDRSVLLALLRSAYRALPDDLFEGSRESDEVYAVLDALMDVNYQRELAFQCKEIKSLKEGEDS